MIEFLEELIDYDPSAEFPREAYKAGTFVPRTGDAVADDWFKQIAEGKTPDFMAALDEEDRTKLEKVLKGKQDVAVTEQAAGEMPEEFHDTYGDDDAVDD